MEAMTGRDGSRSAAVANLVVGLLGLLCFAAALRMDAVWQWAHFLPTWAWPWSTQLRMLLGLRLLVAAVGLAIIVLLRRWLVRAVVAGRGREAIISCVTATLAVTAAFAVTEGVLHTRTWRSVQERWDQEPLRVRSAEYGWAFMPDHAGYAQVGERKV